jgi:hypothetical protein
LDNPPLPHAYDTHEIVPDTFFFATSLVIDLDSPGTPFAAGWASVDSRTAARLGKQP